MTLTLPAGLSHQDAQRPEPTLRATMIAGAAAVLIGFGGFFGWAFTADLDSAAIASGTIIVDSHRKTVSHLEGGILRELLVKDGDFVTAGQSLLRLDDTQVRALLAQLRNQYWSALARAGRLRAEQEESRTASMPDELAEAARTHPSAADIVEDETRVFRTRRETYEGTIAAQRMRIAQLREQIEAFKAQHAATSDRLTYTQEELATVKRLLDKGYERRPRLLELQRVAADLQGRLGELAARQAEAEQTIAATELDIITIENTRRSDIAADLRKAQTEVIDLGERLRATADIARRHEVTAPQAGRVTELRYFTPGSVVPAGAPILDLVPQNDTLIVEARVAPSDIESVHQGQSAHVRLTAYKQRKVAPFEGDVLTVSADQLRDERTGTAYFLARVRIRPDALEEHPTVKLYPGMPAEVMIRNTPRKAIDYFLSPITDSMRRAFREE